MIPRLGIKFWRLARSRYLYFPGEERLMAWLHNFRRIVTRWEVRVENYIGFVHLGCIRILLRQYR